MKIDLAGHFGSSLSYATVSTRLALALEGRGALGNLINLDDRVTEPTIAALAARKEPQSKRLMLLTDPRPQTFENFAGLYSAENVAIFMSPNSDEIDQERMESCYAAGRIYVPSMYCVRAVINADEHNAPYSRNIVLMPLGVADQFLAGQHTPSRGPVIRFLHVTTDTFWPGRKGTEELLRAWKQAALRDASLTIHCLPALYDSVFYLLGDLELIGKNVKLVCTGSRGSSDASLSRLFDEHDVLVQPSRSEGFGIMPLSALMYGMPVVMTANTGQEEYLWDKFSSASPEAGLKGWLQVPTMSDQSLAGEHGHAPEISREQLAFTLRSACVFYSDLRRGAQTNEQYRKRWSWSAQAGAWAESLESWESEHGSESVDGSGSSSPGELQGADHREASGLGDAQDR